MNKDIYSYNSFYTINLECPSKLAEPDIAKYKAVMVACGSRAVTSKARLLFC